MSTLIIRHSQSVFSIAAVLVAGLVGPVGIGDRIAKTPLDAQSRHGRRHRKEACARTPHESLELAVECAGCRAWVFHAPYTGVGI